MSSASRDSENSCLHGDGQSASADRVADSLSRVTTHALIRKAFVIALGTPQVDEYVRRHNPIWPELATMLKAHGVHNYSIFHHAATQQVFGYVEIEDEARWERSGMTEIGQRWRKYMSDILPTRADFSPVAALLPEVFHLE